MFVVSIDSNECVHAIMATQFLFATNNVMPASVLMTDIRIG